MPDPMMAASVCTVPNTMAEAADPMRNTESVSRRPHTSISHAATAYPGS